MSKLNLSLSCQTTCANIVKDIQDNFVSLWEIWGRMGLEEYSKNNRAESARLHINNLVKEMIAEESNLLNKLSKTIEELSAKLDILCKGLSVPKFQLPGGLPIIKQEKALRAEYDKRNAEREERMTKLHKLQASEAQLCSSLVCEPHFLPADAVPSMEQLRQLEKHVCTLQIEKEKRFTEFVGLKKDIVQLYDSLETDPDTSMGRDLICEDDDTFTLSAENLESLKKMHKELLDQEIELKKEVSYLWEHLRALWERLEIPDIEREEFEYNKEGHGKKVISLIRDEIEACEKLKFQNMQKFILGIRNELVVWWDKCFYSPAQRNAFKEYHEDHFTEVVLDIHEAELKNVKDLYRNNQAIFEKIESREKLFSEMKAFDEKASDPNRFFNDRGGKLLREEKARKKLLKDLPKVENEVKKAVLDWERSANKEFLVFGMRYPDYIVKQWDDFHLDKEEKKQTRLKAKERQTKDEALYGTPARSAKWPHGPGSPVTPQRTPLKARKLNDLPKTPNTTSKLPNFSRMQHSTVLHSPIARKPLYTPKTPAASASSRLKRRSIRLMKKAATERKSLSRRRRSRESFSATTVSSEDAASSSLASTGTYLDFANGLHRCPNSRSSVLHPVPLMPQNKH